MQAAELIHFGKLIHGCQPPVLDCEHCGFKHLERFPADAVSKYQSSLSKELSEDGNTIFVDVRAVDVNNILLPVESEYWLGKQREVMDEAEDLDWHRMNAVDRSVVIRRFKHKIYKFLEIGCGRGFHLQFYADRFPEAHVIGIEPDSEECRKARVRLPSAAIIEGTWEAMNEMLDNSTDVVLCQFVLEHVTDPAGLLRQVSRVLVPKGVLCIVVPNDFTQLQEEASRKIRRPNYWVCEDHVNYFDFASLQALVKRCNLSIVALSATFPMERFLLAGLDYINKPEIGRIVHKARVQCELEANSMGYAETWNRRGIAEQRGFNHEGRDAVVFAQK